MTSSDNNFNATASPFPLVLMSFGGMAFPKKIFLGNGIPPRLHHWC